MSIYTYLIINQVLICSLAMYVRSSQYSYWQICFFNSFLSLLLLSHDAGFSVGVDCKIFDYCSFHKLI